MTRNLVPGESVARMTMNRSDRLLAGVVRLFSLNSKGFWAFVRKAADLKLLAPSNSAFAFLESEPQTHGPPKQIFSPKQQPLSEIPNPIPLLSS